MEDYGVFWYVTVLNSDGTPPVAPFSFGAGPKVVGTEVPPGTYRTRAASSGCYWERLSGFGGTFEEIIANNNTDDPEIVTIAATDRGFDSTRCALWTNDLSPITSSPSAPFGGGTLIVGTDISAGTWRAPVSRGCYWARLSGFGGRGIDEIIANDNTDNGALVTISGTDKGFTSSRCGTWTKVG